MKKLKLMTIVGTRPEILNCLQLSKNATSILSIFWFTRGRTMIMS